VDKGNKIRCNDTEIQSIATRVSEKMVLTECTNLKRFFGKEEYINCCIRDDRRKWSVGE
jgi:hypothetical protein